MSHYASMEVEYQGKYEPELLMAIEEIIEARVEVHENPVDLIDYYGNKASQNKDVTTRAEKCHIVARNNAGKLADRLTNDCGWRRTEEGGFRAFIDEAGITKEEQGLINQSYTTAVAVKQLAAQGWLTNKKVFEDGRIQLVATKF